ncbi:MAG: hypothetical protein M3M89_00230 [Thermoproteota archaeon]|nr:hypothetical protein [Thermoproteota archaeon]
MQKGQDFVVNYGKTFTDGNFLDTALGACESAVMDFKKVLQPSNQEASASIDSNNNEVGKVGSVTYPSHSLQRL